MRIITKHYLDNKFLSHSQYPEGFEGNNLPTGIIDPAEESMNEEEFEAERDRREEKLENQSEL